MFENLILMKTYKFWLNIIALRPVVSYNLPFSWRANRTTLQTGHRLSVLFKTSLVKIISVPIVQKKYIYIYIQYFDISIISFNLGTHLLK